MSRTPIETYETIQVDRSTVAEKIRRALPQKACFIVMAGMDVGRVIVLDRPVITIGRNVKCAVVLQDDGVSRFHVKVRREAEVLISTADANLFRAKRLGRNQVVASPVFPMPDKQ